MTGLWACPVRSVSVIVRLLFVTGVAVAVRLIVVSLVAVVVPVSLVVLVVMRMFMGMVMAVDMGVRMAVLRSAVFMGMIVLMAVLMIVIVGMCVFSLHGLLLRKFAVCRLSWRGKAFLPEPPLFFSYLCMLIAPVKVHIPRHEQVLSRRAACPGDARQAVLPNRCGACLGLPANTVRPDRPLVQLLSTLLSVLLIIPDNSSLLR